MQVNADDELSRFGPDVVHRGDLDVDEVELQRLGAHHVLGDVRRNLGGLLRPRDPDRAVLVEVLLEVGQSSGKFQRGFDANAWIVP